MPIIGRCLLECSRSARQRIEYLCGCRALHDGCALQQVRLVITTWQALQFGRVDVAQPIQYIDEVLQGLSSEQWMRGVQSPKSNQGFRCLHTRVLLQTLQ